MILLIENIKMVVIVSVMLIIGLWVVKDVEGVIGGLVLLIWYGLILGFVVVY